MTNGHRGNRGTTVKGITGWVGVISLIVGIVLSVGNIAIWRLQRDSYALDNSNKRAQLQEAKPRFDVTYASMPLSFYRQLIMSRHNAEAPLSGFLRYPILVNDVQKRILVNCEDIGDLSNAKAEWRNVAQSDSHNGSELKRVVSSKRFCIASSSVTCLAITQEGKRNAVRVRLDVDKIVLRGAEELYDDTDAVGLVHRGKCSNETLDLGSIDTGQGVIVPLFLTELLGLDRGMFLYPTDIIRMTRGTVYLPKTIRFTDPLTGEETAYSVRRMLSAPLLIESGIETRG